MTNSINKILLNALLLYSQIAVAQSTELISRTYISDKRTYVEEYEVLENNKNIKHGKYILLEKILKQGVRYNHNEIVKEDSLYYHTLISKGIYRANEKDSIWTENFGLKFYKVGSYKMGQKEGNWQEFYECYLCGTGNYDKDKKMGIWNYFYNKYYQDSIKTYLTYNYDSDSVLFLETSYIGIGDHGFDTADRRFKLTRNPIFPYGGYRTLTKIIGDCNINTWSEIPSSVYHTYYKVNIDENGHSDIKVVKVNRDYDDFIKNFFDNQFKYLPKEWIPAQIEDGKKYPSVTIYTFKVALD